MAINRFAQLRYGGRDRSARFVADWFAMILAAAILLLAQVASASAPVAITHVTVIDTAGGRRGRT